MLCYVLLCYAMPCYAMPCYAMSCYAMLRCAMLCYVMLCYDSMLCNFIYRTRFALVSGLGDHAYDVMPCCAMF